MLEISSILGKSQNNCQLGSILLISFMGGVFGEVFCLFGKLLCAFLTVYLGFFKDTTRLFYMLGSRKGHLFGLLWQTQLSSPLQRGILKVIFDTKTRILELNLPQSFQNNFQMLYCGFILKLVFEI